MILDLRESDDGQRFDADICVLGSGPAAMSFVLKYLGRAITKIIMVESGGLDGETEVQELY
jgi:hypothetical protein